MTWVKGRTAPMSIDPHVAERPHTALVAGYLLLVERAKRKLI